MKTDKSFLIEQLSGVDELKFAYIILLELRPNLAWVDFLNIYKEAAARDEYQLVGLSIENKLVGVMGFRLLFDYVHGRHLYIDDLVITETCRNKGSGAHLLKYAENFAKTHQCKKIRLCTGVDNEKGKNFYQREGWEVRAIVFKKTVNTI
jgi:ribosomal protein S18 acetylase RimI-like enzyme